MEVENEPFHSTSDPTKSIDMIPISLTSFESNRCFNLSKIRRYYDFDDPFFEEGNSQRESWAKQTTIPISNDLTKTICNEQEDISESRVQNLEKFSCLYPNCSASFFDIISFENHYSAVHRHVCGVCNQVFPTARFLELHILEQHDSFFKLLSLHQKMYECLVEGCGRKFAGNFQRRLHLIDYHKYPKDFDMPYRKLPCKKWQIKNRSESGRNAT
jgi:hypothetical protein